MPAIGDVYRVIVSGRLIGTVETRNMFGYVLEAANATEEEIAVALEDHVYVGFTELVLGLSNQWTLYRTETQKWHPPVAPEDGYWQTYHLTARNLTGTETGDITGYQPAALIVLKTLGKKVMGRKFLAGVAEPSTELGAIVGSLVTKLGVFLIHMMDFVVMGVGGEAVPGVLSKSGIFYKFVGGTVGSILSSMRRRKPGYGI